MRPATGSNVKLVTKMCRHVIVTGAAGFIGSHLVDTLLEKGCRVTGIDNFVRGTAANLAKAHEKPGFTFLQTDVSCAEECREAFRSCARRQAVDMVWHMAANSDIRAGGDDPGIDLRDTFLTTFRSLECMRELGIGRLAFASSSAVYGDREDALTEDSGPMRPVSNYGAMKLASESVISAALESWLQCAWIFRFPNVIGSRATHGVIFDLIQRLLEHPGEPLKVLGDGAQQKPYLHVSELLDAMHFVMGSGAALDRLNIYNISADDDGATVKFIAETVVENVRPGTRIRYTGGTKGWRGDVPRFSYSPEKLQRLGWTPRLSSHDAVRRAVKEVNAQMDPCSLLS